eukprot:3016717-Amphidinium_carterae.1
MAKEWNSWKTFSAVDLIPEAEIPKDAVVIPTRCVHVNKAAGVRGTGEAKLEAKSRLVVQGHKEQCWSRSDAPTGSHLAFTMICSFSASLGWVLKSTDASTAFLQAQGIGRLLLLRPPQPCPEESSGMCWYDYAC